MSFAAAAKTSPPDATAPWTAAPVLGPAPALDLPAARRYCAAMATSHYENFPVFLAPFSPEQREALAAVYAFARTADDFADEPAFDGRRERLLDGWETALGRCFDGRADHPVFVALREAVARFALEPRPFLDLLSAFRQDVHVQRYATFDDVLDYCRRSADPVGRLVLRILRIDDPLARGWSDRLCTALQLANFWQDLSVDVPRGRLYLPLADLDRFAVPLADVLEQRPTRRVGALLRFELDRTAALFSAGFPLVAHAGWPGGAYLAAVWAGGRSVVGMTRALGPAILRERPGLGGRSVTRWAWSVLRRSRVNT
jgi:squalene synthase HpnC